MSSREQPNRNRWTLLPPGPPHKLPRRPGTTPGLHIAGHILSLDTLSQRRSPHHSRTLPPAVHRARTKAVGSSHGTDPPRTGKLGSKIHSGLSQRGDRRPRRRLIRKAHEQATKTRRSPVAQRGIKPERAGLSPGKTVEPAASSSGSVNKFQEILHNESELKRIHCAKQPAISLWRPPRAISGSGDLGGLPWAVSPLGDRSHVGGNMSRGCIQACLLTFLARRAGDPQCGPFLDVAGCFRSSGLGCS